MLAIHLILLTVEEHYGEVPAVANIFCDNKGTICTFSKEHKRKRVPAAAKNTYCVSFGAYSANPNYFTAFHTLNPIKMTNYPFRCSRYRHSSTVTATRGLNGQLLRTQLTVTEGWNALPDEPAGTGHRQNS